MEIAKMLKMCFPNEAQPPLPSSEVFNRIHTKARDSRSTQGFGRETSPFVRVEVIRRWVAF